MRKFRGKRKHRNKANAQAQASGSGGGAGKMADTEQTSDLSHAEAEIDLTSDEKVENPTSGNESPKKILNPSSSPSTSSKSSKSGKRKQRKLSASAASSSVDEVKDKCDDLGVMVKEDKIKDQNNDGYSFQECNTSSAEESSSSDNVKVNVQSDSVVNEEDDCYGSNSSCTLYLKEVDGDNNVDENVQTNIADNDDENDDDDDDKVRTGNDDNDDDKALGRDDDAQDDLVDDTNTPDLRIGDEDVGIDERIKNDIICIGDESNNNEAEDNVVEDAENLKCIIDPANDFVFNDDDGNTDTTPHSDFEMSCELRISESDLADNNTCSDSLIEVCHVYDNDKKDEINNGAILKHEEINYYESDDDNDIVMSKLDVVAASEDDDENALVIREDGDEVDTAASRDDGGDNNLNGEEDVHNNVVDHDDNTIVTNNTICLTTMQYVTTQNDTDLLNRSESKENDTSVNADNGDSESMEKGLENQNVVEAVGTLAVEKTTNSDNEDGMKQRNKKSGIDNVSKSENGTDLNTESYPLKDRSEGEMLHNCTHNGHSDKYDHSNPLSDFKITSDEINSTQSSEHSTDKTSEELSKDAISENNQVEGEQNTTYPVLDQSHNSNMKSTLSSNEERNELSIPQNDRKSSADSDSLHLDNLYQSLYQKETFSDPHTVEINNRKQESYNTNDGSDTSDNSIHQTTLDTCYDMDVTDNSNKQLDVSHKPEEDQLSTCAAVPADTLAPTETTPITNPPSSKSSSVADAMNYESLQHQHQTAQHQVECDQHQDQIQQLQRDEQHQQEIHQHLERDQQQHEQIRLLQQQLQDQQEAMTRLQAHAHAQQVQANLSTTSLRTKLRRKDQELKALKVHQENNMSVVIAHLLYLEGQMQKEHKDVTFVLNEKDDVVRRQRAAIEDLTAKNNRLLQALKESHGYSSTENGLYKSTKPQVVMQNGSYSIQDHGNKVVLRGNKEKGGEKEKDKEKRSSTGQKVRFSGMKERLRRHKSSLELYQSEPLEPVVEGKLRYFGSEENLVDNDRPSLYIRKRFGSDSDDRKIRYGSLVDFPDDLREVDESVHDSPDSCFGEESNSLENIYSSDSFIYSSSLPNGDGRTNHHNHTTNNNNNNNNASGRYASSNSYGFNELSKSRSVPQSLPTVSENGLNRSTSKHASSTTSKHSSSSSSSNSTTAAKERPSSLPSVENLYSQEPPKGPLYPNVIPVSTPPSESNPFKSFKNVFKRRGSKKKRSVSLGQNVNKEYQDAMKQHFKKYDLT